MGRVCSGGVGPSLVGAVPGHACRGGRRGGPQSWLRPVSLAAAPVLVWARPEGLPTPGGLLCGTFSFPNPVSGARCACLVGLPCLRPRGPRGVRPAPAGKACARVGRRREAPATLGPSHLLRVEPYPLILCAAPSGGPRPRVWGPCRCSHGQGHAERGLWTRRRMRSVSRGRAGLPASQASLRGQGESLSCADTEKPWFRTSAWIPALRSRA